MSFHTFSTTLGAIQIVVNSGWDRPLQGFFMTIIKQSDEEEDEHLFNHLAEPVSYPKEINCYLHELEQRGITLPEQMVNELLADGMRNVGNKYVVHLIQAGRYVREQLF